MTTTNAPVCYESKHFDEDSAFVNCVPSVLILNGDLKKMYPVTEPRPLFTNLIPASTN